MAKTSSHGYFPQQLAHEQEENYIDDIIEHLMTAQPERRPPGDQYAPLIDANVSLDQVCYITRRAALSFQQQKPLLRIEKNQLPLSIVGDIHGQFRELRIILTRCGDPATNGYLFLGDYVDRGIQGVECTILLLCLKIRYPNKVFLLRGNHEDHNTATTYGFYDECILKYAPHGEQVWAHFVNCFNWMPVAALVGERILAMHGGISPHIDSLATIERLPRPSIIPPYGLMCDLVWADPENKYRGWALSSRGISFTFDDSLIESFCAKFGIELIVRAHQINSEMFKNGYKFFAGGRLVSIFSAPNYLNLYNDSCVLRVSPELSCRFLVFKPRRARNAPPPVASSSEASTAVEL